MISNKFLIIKVLFLISVPLTFAHAGDGLIGKWVIDKKGGTSVLSNTDRTAIYRICNDSGNKVKINGSAGEQSAEAGVCVDVLVKGSSPLTVQGGPALGRFEFITLTK